MSFKKYILIENHISCRKVFKKLGFELAEDVLHNVINAQPFAIEKVGVGWLKRCLNSQLVVTRFMGNPSNCRVQFQVLVLLRRKIDRYIYEQKRHKEHEDRQKNAAPTLVTARKGKDAAPVGKNQGGNVSDRPEADQNITGQNFHFVVHGGSLCWYPTNILKDFPLYHWHKIRFVYFHRKKIVILFLKSRVVSCVICDFCGCFVFLWNYHQKLWKERRTQVTFLFTAYPTDTQ